MRIAVTGSKFLTVNHFNKVKVEGTEDKYVKRTLNDILSGIYYDLFEDGDQIVFIEAGGDGADRLVKEWCKSHGVLYEEYPCNSDSEGNAVCHARNQEMAEKCDFCLAFPAIGLLNLKTFDMVDRCKALGKRVYTYWMEI